MANRQLSAGELLLANKLLAFIRRRLLALSDGDEKLLWALRRKISKELVYDERGKPMFRRSLKKLKRAEQRGKCAICKRVLPETYVVLDRLNAMGGYTVKNTRLIHQDCDTKVQRSRKYA